MLKRHVRHLSDRDSVKDVTFAKELNAVSCNCHDNANARCSSEKDVATAACFSSIVAIADAAAARGRVGDGAIARLKPARTTVCIVGAPSS